MADLIDTLRNRDKRTDRSRCRGCGEPHTVSATFQIKHPKEEGQPTKSVSLTASLCDDCAIKAWEANAKVLER